MEFFFICEEYCSFGGTKANIFYIESSGATLNFAYGLIKATF